MNLDYATAIFYPGEIFELISCWVYFLEY